MELIQPVIEVQSSNVKLTWESPEMVTISVATATLGDPTISDDGLGDGLFS